jgi:hypothetical protein
MIDFPKKGTYASFYHNYISYLENKDVIARLKDQVKEIDQLVINNISKADYAYADGKWTFKKVLIHLCDAERVFAYRVFCFSRGERQSLPGFDQNEYIDDFNFDHLSIDQVWGELKSLRKSNIQMIEGLTDEQIENSGIASGNEITCKALIFIMAGHVDHHVKVLKEKYQIV